MTRKIFWKNDFSVLGCICIDVCIYIFDGCYLVVDYKHVSFWYQAMFVSESLTVKKDVSLGQSHSLSINSIFTKKEVGIFTEYCQNSDVTLVSFPLVEDLKKGFNTSSGFTMHLDTNSGIFPLPYLGNSSALWKVLFLILLCVSSYSPREKNLVGEPV